MPEESFFCPHCNSRIKKRPQAYLMGESMTTKDAHFIALGGIPDTAPCPSCGGEIDSQKMMLGEYDARSGSNSNSGGAVGFIVLAGVVALVVYFIWFR